MLPGGVSGCALRDSLSVVQTKGEGPGRVHSVGRGRADGAESTILSVFEGWYGIMGAE